MKGPYSISSADGRLRFYNLARYRARRERYRDAMRALYVTQPFKGRIVVALRLPKALDHSLLAREFLGDRVQMLQSRTYGTGHVLPTIDERTDYVLERMREEGTYRDVTYPDAVEA